MESSAKKTSTNDVSSEQFLNLSYIFWEKGKKSEWEKMKKRNEWEEEGREKDSLNEIRYMWLYRFERVRVGVKKNLKRKWKRERERETKKDLKRERKKEREKEREDIKMFCVRRMKLKWSVAKENLKGCHYKAHV